MVRIALAPTSPFSVTGELMRETAELARARGVRLHTHLAETDDEEAFCLERFGVRPLQYLDDLGWLGDDVWLAHCVHLDGDETRADGRDGHRRRALPDLERAARRRDRARPGAAGRRRAGRARASTARRRTSAASCATSCGRRSCVARAKHGPTALTARQALELATRHGARCLGRDDELGHLSEGAVADVALWRHGRGRLQAGIADPVAALVLGPTRPVDTLLVAGEPVVERGELRTADPVTLAADLARESARLAERSRA